MAKYSGTAKEEAASDTLPASPDSFSMDINEHVRWRHERDGHTSDPCIHMHVYRHTYTHSQARTW